ncbi:caspase family protein [Bradyrhizobium sediminis]|uniref:Caspase family protein n=1 Tax=Bradyrhizobium sediminis TaxID=2840469 RepID=A0A975P3G3_9BRAD|nr:caspase family protein [Bradyrhizobium sediminis]QWG25419.1 caspase family protein [Bradyrhizobium sediminis]
MNKRLLGMAMTIGTAILSMVLPLDDARAEKRVALVVGNSNYASVPKLPNPSRDANSVAQMFRDAGFDAVDVVLNVGNLEFKRAIRKFEVDADRADIAVVYYAGHGLEIGGTNYLIPIDARLASDRDAEDEAIPLERMVSSADGASKLRVVILDACRDNPFTTLMRRDRKGSNRVVASGLGKAEPTSIDTLIAYAAKAGSTAEDGDGQHSPFTSAILKHLTIPGLDIRLAFGRVRDEVMRTTGARQEPFVYGSLGGGNISLVPAPKVQEAASASDIKADYDLVAKIGTLRAWEVFLGTYKTGFYADLARVQVANLTEQQAASVSRSKGNTVVAAAPSADQPASGRESSSKEALDWDKIKDTSDQSALEKFIARYPNAPLAINAQQRLDILKQAAREREKAAEEARIQAEQKKAEAAAARKREEEERRARAAEAEQKAKAAEAERIATRKREEEERRAKAAEAEQKAKAVEAERKAAEARKKAEEAERNKAAAEAAAARAESERQARQAEAERRKAEQASALEAACKAEQTKFEQLSAKGSDGAGVENMVAFAKAVTCDRLRAQVTVTLNKFYNEATCRAEQARFDDLLAKGSDGAGFNNMKALAKAVACDRLRPQIVAAVDKFTAEAAKRAAAMPNSPQLVLAAQTELVRLGCLPGKPDGKLNAATKTALVRFVKTRDRPSEDVPVTEALVAELGKATGRVCPPECKAGETLKDDKCVAADKPAAPAATSRRKDDDEDETPARRKPKPEKRQAEKEPRRQAPERARQQATARPSGGGGGSTMIGVGF